MVREWRCKGCTRCCTTVLVLLSAHLPRWKRLLADVLLKATAGVDVEGWVSQRHDVSLQELFAGPASRSIPQPLGFFPRLLGSLGWLSGNSYVQSLAALARLIAQPVYLADKVAPNVCGPVLRPLS